MRPPESASYTSLVASFNLCVADSRRTVKVGKLQMHFWDPLIVGASKHYHSLAYKADWGGFVQKNPGYMRSWVETTPATQCLITRKWIRDFQLIQHPGTWLIWLRGLWSNWISSCSRSLLTVTSEQVRSLAKLTPDLEEFPCTAS